MGSGKTSFGRRLAAELGWEFVDLDQYIIAKEKKSVNEIFAEGGEKRFRELETCYLEETTSSTGNRVLSLGGGTPCFENNWIHIRKTKSIYLRRTPNFLFKILHTRKAKRPLIKDLNDKQLLEFITHKLGERELFYRKADVVLNAYGSRRNIIDKLIVAIENQ